jgi:hypothetical protein
VINILKYKEVIGGCTLINAVLLTTIVCLGSALIAPSMARAECGVHCRNLKEMDRQNTRSFEDMMNKPDEGPRHKDPIDEAAGNILGSLLKRGLEQQEQQQRQQLARRNEFLPSVLQSVVARGIDIEPASSVATFNGIVTNRSGDKTTIKIAIDESHPEHGVFGRLFWQEFGSVHVITGRAQGNRLTFEDMLPIRAGTQSVGCWFDIFLKGATGEGSYRCASHSGRFQLRRS